MAMINRPSRMLFKSFHHTRKSGVWSSYPFSCFVCQRGLNEEKAKSRRYSSSSRADRMIDYIPSRPSTGLNLGYTCDNLTLERLQKRKTSRSCIRRTFDQRGVRHVSRLALENAIDLFHTLEWNAQNGIFLYRVTSHLFPWSQMYQVEDLPDFEDILTVLAAAGDVARKSGQRITAHPPHYIKLASPDTTLVAKSKVYLELQSKIFDWMGFAPSYWNKMVIHVGGVYGDKGKSLGRFAKSFEQLSDAVQQRLTVENDDRPNSYGVADLHGLHQLCSIPITFDAHHQNFCSGGMSAAEAFHMAYSTWPSDVRPVVHWSESPEDPDRAKKSPHAHSCFVYGPLDVFGYEDKVDIMIEAKAREVALLLYRDEIAPRHASILECCSEKLIESFSRPEIWDNSGEVIGNNFRQVSSV